MSMGDRVIYWGMLIGVVGGMFYNYVIKGLPL